MLRFLLPAAALLLFASGALAQITADAPEAQGLVAVPGFPASGLIGRAPFDDFGASASGAGDVNGDGYDDLVVGAPGNDAGGASAGQAYVYFGGPGASASESLTFTGEAAGDGLGGSVSGAGDVNGDGYADLVIGAPGSDVGGSNAGQAFVYFGGPGADNVADLTFTGEAASDVFGSAASGAGDINGDGYADVIIGAPGNDAGGAGAGRAYVYFGGPGADAVPDLTFTGEAASDRFGSAASGVGDVNGDGHDDVLIGAYLNDGAGETAGRAYVYFGGPGADEAADLVLSGEAAGDEFGRSVAAGGDVDGDGFADLLIGATGNDAGGAAAGRAYVFFGGPGADTSPDRTFTGEAAGDQFGIAASGAGDLNGDGYADVIVGAANNDAGGSGAGRAYVYFGGPSADTAADLTLTGAGPFEFFGTSVSGAGDLDGDGLTDFIVGATDRNTINGTRTGVVSLFSNANIGAGIEEWRAVGAASGDEFGSSVSDAGDVNGDGYGDIIVGAPESELGAPNGGAAYVYFGGPGADAVPDLTLTGQNQEVLGSSVSGAGDVNGDGYGDVIVGAANSSVGGSPGAGAAYVYFGGPGADASPDLTLFGEDFGDNLGWSVSGAGDVNGDGYADVVAGAPFNNAVGGDAGRAYVYFGGPTPDTVPDLVFTGEAFGDLLGTSVSGAGDVNGDGYADLVIGAYRNDGGGTDAGRAYVYFGGPNADATPDLTLSGEAAEDFFGLSVSGAGDVNSDGYDDVMVGAPLNDSGGLNAGRAYVFFGGQTVDAIPDLTFDGEASLDRLGDAASGAGDVNGDGYADILIGVPENDAGGLSAGRVYVHFGGPSPDAVADLVMTGEAAGDDFGDSVSGAGDTDGDGRADVLIGAPHNGMAGANAGAAVLYRATGPAASPGLYRLADVPGDQGGFVTLQWTRSDAETSGVTGYFVERSEPAGAGGYAWEPLATVPATGNPRYSLTAATTSDQTPGHAGVMCFRVTASGASGESWRSMVKCGASVDNLAPSAPLALILTASGDGDVALAWDEVLGEPDLAGYDVFKSADAACDATDALVGSASGEAAFEDDATAFGTDAWYCVAARDVHGNRSAVTPEASANPAVLAAVKVVLQGAYEPGLPGGALMRADIEDVLPLAQPFSGAPWNYSGAEAISPEDVSPANGRPDVLDANEVVDWVLVAVRSTASGADEGRAAALLLADGTLLDPASGEPYASVKPVAEGAYHVAVHHRSHLAAMTAFAIGLSPEAPGSAYDLSANVGFVYGSNAVAPLAGGVFGLWAGDADASGSILAPDQQGVWLPSVGQTGYLPGDFDLDGSVLANDQQVYWLPNVGVQSAVPGASGLASGEAPEARRE